MSSCPAWGEHPAASAVQLVRWGDRAETQGSGVPPARPGDTFLPGTPRAADGQEHWSVGGFYNNCEKYAVSPGPEHWTAGTAED